MIAVPQSIRTEPEIDENELKAEITFFEWLFGDTGPYKGNLKFDSKTLEKLLWRIPNVVSPVRIGGDFNALNKEEEQYLRQLMDEYNCIAMSYGYIADNQLMIYKGPLSGKSDMVKKIDRHKRIADIEVYLWHQPKRVRVGLEIIDKITAQEYAKIKLQ